jgi:hypothetical protein
MFAVAGEFHIPFQRTMMKREISHESNRKHDLIAAAIIGLYCLLHFALRVLVSPSMELDESEQFLQVTALHIGPQPLLYSVIVKTVSLLSGQLFLTIIIVKYVILLTFYLCFYGLARTHWNARESLVVTASLMLFPTYAYEFVRDLSHSILGSAFAVIAALLYIKTLSSKGAKISFALLIALCLGMLSKYVFIFFLVSLVLSDSIVKERWKPMNNRWMMLVFIFLSLFSIALIMLLDADAIPFLRVISAITHQGNLDLGAPKKVSNLLFKVFMEILIFSSVFLLFFRRHISILTGKGFPRVIFFRSLAVLGTLIPLATILLFRLGQFRARWLAPVMFSIPLAFFSLVDLKKDRKLKNLFGYCCAAIAISILLFRTAVGFFPDVTGKKERIHIPFQAVSAELKHMLDDLRLGDAGDLVIISNRQYLIANIMQCLHMRHYVLISDEHNTPETEYLPAVRLKRGIIVWNASAQGESIPQYFLEIFPSAKPLEPVRVPYIRSKEMFTMGVAIVPEV